MTEDYGTIERKPYVGDSDILVVTCAYGDYERIVKGAGMRGGPTAEATQRKAEKSLAEHYTATHVTLDQTRTLMNRLRKKKSTDG